MTLAAANEPLVLADGTKIDPTTRKVVKENKSKWVEVPSASEAQRIITRTRRSIADLPMPAKQMNVISVVLTYTLYGLPPQDIAIATGMTFEQIDNIRKLEAYTTMEEAITKSLMETEVNDVRQLFQKNAINAAQKVLTIAEEEDGALGFKAAQDILDRAGFRPADIVEHKHTMANSLQIEFIKREATSEVPIIDITPTEVNEDGYHS